LNFDETNIDFVPSPRSTLIMVGERLISIHISGHSGRLTVQCIWLQGHLESVLTGPIGQET
jgi:hypothetical protein